MKSAQFIVQEGKSYHQEPALRSPHQEGDSRMLSIIIPDLSACPLPPRIYSKVRKHLATLGCRWELLFTSFRASQWGWMSVQKLIQGDPKHVRAVSASEASDLSEALSLGYAAAVGELVLTLELDLNEDPAQLPFLLHRIGWNAPRTHQIQLRRAMPTTGAWQRIMPRGLLRGLPSAIARLPHHEPVATPPHARAA